MPSAIQSVVRSVLWLVLVITLAACSSREQQAGIRADSRLSAAQLSRVQAAIRSLPLPLYKVLSARQLYSFASPVPVAADGYPAIGLSADLLNNQMLTDEALRRAILLQFFQARGDELNLFCQNRQACQTQGERNTSLRQFFNGYGVLGQQGKNDQTWREAYALHATEYFTDQRYHCKRPLAASVLEAAWGYRRENSPCTERVPFMVAEGESSSAIRWIDPARVYAVHLLFAGSTGSSMSRFGHVTLRIVLCAKDRTVVDQGCEEDLLDHLSLGFKANIDELDLSVWKGIKGGYPMKLYAKSFIDTYREYSIDEFRDVYSLPLVLTEQDKTLLVAALAEIHWSYRSDYRFFTKNCATEVQWILNSLSFARQTSATDFFHNQRYRPDKLFADAKRSTRFRGEVLINPTTAEQQGYYFPSTEGYYQLAVNSIAGTLPITANTDTHVHTPQEWFQKSARKRAEYWLKPAIERSQRKKYTVHAALVLEGWVARKLRRKLLSGLTYYYASIIQSVINDDRLLKTAEIKMLADCVDAINSTDNAGARHDGIPQYEPKITLSACDVKDEQLVALLRRLFEAFPVDTEQRNSIKELTDTLENIHTINAVMSS